MISHLFDITAFCTIGCRKNSAYGRNKLNFGGEQYKNGKRVIRNDIEGTMGVIPHLFS